MSATRWRSPKALLLDIDNTVYPYEPCHKAGMSAAFEESRRLDLWQDQKSFASAYDAARRSVKTRIHKFAAGHSRLLYFKEMTEALFGFTSFDHICGLEQAYWDGYASQMKLDVECRTVLGEASGLGIRLAWVSNFTTARQIWKLRHLGLDTLNALLVTSEEAGADKPDPAILDLALLRLGISGQETAEGEAWLIGDEPADINAARSRQLPILHLCREEKDMEDKPGDLKRPVASWSEIREVLKHARN